MSSDTDDAVGVGKSQWFVAIVNHNSEMNVQDRLSRLGYESYVASQKEIRVRKNGRQVCVDRVVIPSKVFIHCTETQRKELVCQPFINRFMTNIAGTSNGTHKPIVVIPDKEIDVLRFMLGASDTPVNITSRPFVRGEIVRVVRGKLSGLEGEIAEEPDGTSSLIVCLNLLGYARVTINPASVEHVQNS